MDDSRPAGTARRLTAALLDGAASLLVAMLLATSVGMYWADRAVVTFHIEDPVSPWKGIGPMLLGLSAPVSYGLGFALVLILLGEMFFGATVGKWFTGIRVCTDRGNLAGAGENAFRFLAKASGPLLYCLALATGWWPLLLAAALASMLTLAGCAIGLFFLGATWHDRLAGTSVRRMKAA